MSKGVFDEQKKIFNLGKEMCEKNGDINFDYSCLLVIWLLVIKILEEVMK